MSRLLLSSAHRWRLYPRRRPCGLFIGSTVVLLFDAFRRNQEIIIRVLVRPWSHRTQRCSGKSTYMQYAIATVAETIPLNIPVTELFSGLWNDRGLDVVIWFYTSLTISNWGHQFTASEAHSPFVGGRKVTFQISAFSKSLSPQNTSFSAEYY